MTHPQVARSADRLLELSLTAQASELDEFTAQQLCFDPIHHDYFLNLLERGQAPAWAVTEHLDFDEHPIEFQLHRWAIAHYAPLTDDQWTRLAGDKFRSVVKAVCEAAQVRPVPVAAHAAALTALIESFDSPWEHSQGQTPSETGIPSWLAPFLPPVSQKWPSRIGEVHIALVDETGREWSSRVAGPATSTVEVLNTLLSEAWELVQSPLSFPVGAMVWWWAAAEPEGLVKGGAITGDAVWASSFDIEPSPGGVLWAVDDHAAQWPEAIVTFYRYMTATLLEGLLGRA